MPDSDSLYHRLFSYPRMVEQLVREFVPEALATGLVFSKLERVNAKFHIGRRPALRREGDVIWRLPTREGKDIYLYLLLEFQGKSDWWMAVRAQVYQGLLWQQVIEEKRLKAGARLPPLLLVVLYNGVRRWSGPTEITELIALPPDSGLWPWQPRVHYHLLDMGAFSRDDLARRTSLAGLLFRLEQSRSSEEFDGLIDEAIGWFRRHEGFDRLQQLFTELVRETSTRFGVRLRPSVDLLEMKMMTPKIGKLWKQQWIAEGRAEGLARGKAEGKAEALLCLLVERFGAVAPTWRRRIRGAKLATLDCWLKRAIVAPDLSSVFDPPR